MSQDTGVSITKRIRADAKSVWAIIAAGDGLELWLPAIAQCALDGRGEGAVRHCTLRNGARLKERIVSIDHTRQQFTYTIDEHPLPARDILGAVSIQDLGAGYASVTWSARYSVDPPHAAEIDALFRGVYEEAIDGLARYASQTTDTADASGADPYRMRLNPVDSASAPPRAREVLDSAMKQVGFIPNMYANMSNAPAMLQTYLLGYKGFREESGLSPAEQETVFLSISRENECGYCMTAHSMIAATKSKVPAPVLIAIRDDAPIPDSKLGALSSFTRTMVRTRGLPSAADAQRFLDAGYTETHILYVILAIAVKTLSNYSNHLFATPIDAIFEKYAWQGPRHTSTSH